MQLTPRKRLFVDPKVQAPLLLRIVAYWCFYVLTIGLLLLTWDIYQGPDGEFFSHFRITKLWNDYGIVLLASAALLPAVLLDALLLSNRLAGPVYRLRRSVRALAAGEYVAPVQFRHKDFWQPLAEEFNQLASEVERLKSGNATSNVAAGDPFLCEPSAKG